MKMHAVSPQKRLSGRSLVISRVPSRSWLFEPPPRQESAHLRKYGTFVVTSGAENSHERCYKGSGVEGALAASQRFTLCASAVRKRL